MELKPEVLTSSKEELKLKFDKIDKGFLNVVKEELWNDKATDIAGFRVTHPQIGVIEFSLKTKGKQAKQVWNSALDRLSKKLTEFNKEVSKV